MSKRMFSSEFLDNDKFLDLPIGAKMLYVYLNLYADSEGFVASVRKAIASSGATQDDFKVLLAKNFIRELQEDEITKVYVITDWWQNNSEKMIYHDNFQETIYQVARGQVMVVNKVYMTIEDYERSKDNKLLDNKSLQITEIHKGKVKNSMVIPTIDEIKEYCNSRNNGIDAEKFYEYYDNLNWKVGNKPMKSWKNCVITWENNNKKRQEKEHPQIDYMKY